MTAEQTFADAALGTWRSNMDRAGKLFGSLTPEELELEVAPTRNRLIYIWGHLCASNDAILPLFGFRNGKTEFRKRNLPITARAKGILRMGWRNRNAISCSPVRTV